jgi:disulfide bond formation protein DsbB
MCARPARAAPAAAAEARDVASLAPVLTAPLSRPFETARALALLVPLFLLIGAYGSQYLGGLAPCEMCYWQRWAHIAGLLAAIGALTMRGPSAGGRALVRLAALGILTSGLIGAYHAGVELGIFAGVTQCTAVGTGGSTRDALRQILDAPIVRCDQPQWQFLAISMAGWNAILSIGFASVILWLSFKTSRTRP